MGNLVSSKVNVKFPKRISKVFKSLKSFKSSKSSQSSQISRHSQYSQYSQYSQSSQSQISQTSKTLERLFKKNEPLKYYLANFEKDTDIMVILHFLGCYLFQSRFNAPVHEKLSQEENYRVLDAGCGAGTWILDLATIYKTPKFVGMDLCAMYPAEIKPDNVEFTQGDISKPLPYDDCSFDYVHLGNMLCVFTLEEWEFVISELIRVCKPGGYIEFTEPELATNTGPILTRFYDALVDLSESRNVTIRIAKDIINILGSSSAVHNVNHKYSTVSLGHTKGGNAGQAYFEVHDGFFLNDPMPDTMCHFMGLSKEDYLKLFDEAKEEVNKGIAPDCDIYRIWCQKL